METVFLSGGDFLLPSYLLQGRWEAVSKADTPGLASAIGTYKTGSDIEKLKAEVAYSPAMPHLGVFPKESKAEHRGVCTAVSGRDSQGLHCKIKTGATNGRRKWDAYAQGSIIQP